MCKRWISGPFSCIERGLGTKLNPVATCTLAKRYRIDVQPPNDGFKTLLAQLGRYRSVFSPCNFTKTVFLDYRDLVQSSMGLDH